jgi:methylated-DNA-protein-cysteine methyltransferase related protein
LLHWLRQSYTPVNSDERLHADYSNEVEIAGARPGSARAGARRQTTSSLCEGGNPVAKIPLMSKPRKTIPSDRSTSMWNPRLVPTSKIRRGILRDGLRPSAERDAAFRRIILSIPPGKVSTYGKVAAAAGYPMYHRAVARLLRIDPADSLPWHRVLGAGGHIKLKQDAALEQRRRLRMEGVKFRGHRVDMERFEYALRSWETF